jgi:hypothetical protein
MNINGLCSPDRRGGATLNKITTELTEAVRKFLQKFPKFKSHYSDSDRIYFHPDLTVKSLHEIYKEQIETGKKAVSLYLERYSKVTTLECMFQRLTLARLVTAPGYTWRRCRKTTPKEHLSWNRWRSYRWEAT